MKTFLHPLFVVSMLLALTFQTAAQDCGTTGRYSDNIFSSVDTTQGIVFGRNSAKSYSTNTNLPPRDLLLDVYQPTGDAATNRPLVILAFGGGFISGTRADMDSIARAFAMRGYVAATIDYRLVTNFMDQFAIATGSDDFKRMAVSDVIVKASADVRAAVRFFRYRAADYKIDPTKIFVGGASAGAIAALHAAYVDAGDVLNPLLSTTYTANGGIEGNTDLPGNSLLGTFNSGGLAGVVNVAGAVLDTTLIDSNDPPVYSAHGISDGVIPFTSGTLSFNASGTTVTIPLELFGSNAINTRAINVGLRSVLLSIPGGHESPRFSPYAEQIVEGSAAFMKVGVCAAVITPTPVRLVSFTVKANRCAAQFSWQTALEENSSHYDIESSTDGRHFTKVATVNSRNASNGTSYSYQIEEASKAAWFRLKMVDKDGSFVYSRAERFSQKCDEISVQVYPNPAQQKATVAGVQAGMLIEVLSADGKLVWSQRAAGNTVDLPVSSFAKGLMLVQVKSNKGALLSSTKLMKN